MTEAAIRNGVYLRSLSRREALALIATPVLDHLLAPGATMRRSPSPTC
jgi:hypothetical protein